MEEMPMKATIMDGTCEACLGGNLTEVDSAGHSQTLACEQCHRCSLRITHPDFKVMIPLRDFHLKRGYGPGRRPLEDQNMARRLVERLLLDQWPSAAAIVDYGIDSPACLGALQYAVGMGVSVYDLDRVIGDGQAITRLTQSVPGQPYQAWFMTVYDAFGGRDDH
jgi:hypothetical protein